MLKETVAFKDLNGNDRTIDLYFNMTEEELITLQHRFPEGTGFQTELEDAIAAKDMRRLLKWMKEIVYLSYGVKGADGITFDKSEEVKQRFLYSAYYSDFLLSLFESEQKAAAFVRGIFPPELIAAADKRQQETQETQRQEAERKAAEAQFRPSAREQFSQPQPVVERSVYDTPGSPQQYSPNVPSVGQPQQFPEAPNPEDQGHVPPHQR